MLSYRHEYHAGNPGDLIKHAVLTLVIEYLKLKPAPIRYIDTHAGAGLYSTRSEAATRPAEYKQGIGALGSREFPPELAAFQQVLARFTPRHEYPGSPLIAANLLREQDELRLFELHSTEFPRLQALFSRDRRAVVANSDGYASMKALLPVKHGRALVLIDPSYELKSDYVAVSTALGEGYNRMPNAIFAVWYPVVQNSALEVMVKKIASTVPTKLWRLELTTAREDAKGMTATGMLVINPPWTLATDLQAAFASICPRLPFAEAAFTATCLNE